MPPKTQQNDPKRPNQRNVYSRGSLYRDSVGSRRLPQLIGAITENLEATLEIKEASRFRPTDRPFSDLGRSCLWLRELESELVSLCFLFVLCLGRGS